MNHPTESQPDIEVKSVSVAPPAQAWAGRIQVVEEVGRGAMGRVLRVFDNKLRRELALKVAPLPRHEMARDRLARFVEEAQITAQLEHPNVVPVHDLGVDPEGHAYFSMKLIRGQSLETILEKRQQGDAETVAEFGLRRLLDVFLQTCQAIEYAHARGVIHRDLKPANIMVGDFGEVQVMDWGVAKLIGRPDSSEDVVSTATERASIPPPPESSAKASNIRGVTSVRAVAKAWETQVGEVLGTPAYMSPEQAKGLPVDERTDIYALGVLLYEILCGQVPFDDEDATRTLERVVADAPPRPTEIDPTVPHALEALALRLLEKEPEQRTLTIPQIRAHVQNYIEGIGRDYRGESIWNTAAWSAGALVLFAFLVWYLTGKSIAHVLVLAPPVVLNAVGWFLLALAVGYPLWAASWALILMRKEPNRFRPPNNEELFVSGYLAHRSFAATLAPLFQLVFIVELVALAIVQVSRGSVGSQQIVSQISQQMRAAWSEALIVILVFCFAYLFMVSTEVRFARRIDRYALLIRRPRWEALWPFFMIFVLLLTIGTTDVLTWVLGSPDPSAVRFVTEQVLTPRLGLFDMVKTMVFQGTFLLGLAAATLVGSFPFSELLAALRLGYQPVDEASVRSRSHYFARAIATFRVARLVFLYGGAMIASLTAITILSDATEHPLVEKILYILGPWLIGFFAYSAIGRYVASYLALAPAVARLLDERSAHTRLEQWRANLDQLERVPRGYRLLQLTVPVLCAIVYLLWTGSGLHRDAIRDLIIPVTSKDWLLILPYVLLIPALLFRDRAQRWILARRLGTSQAAFSRAAP
jgi:serine/threonine protein kinase